MKLRLAQAVIAGTAAAAVAMVVAVGPANAGGAGTHHEALRFRDVTTGTAFVDVNHNRTPDPGDSFVFHEQDVRHGTAVEHNDSQCLVGLAEEYLCHVVVIVEGRGKVVVDGSIAAPGGAFPADFDLAVTGGTGDFARARGYAHVHHVSDTVSDDTLVLLP
jgi:hypothetical protein